MISPSICYPIHCCLMLDAKFQRYLHYWKITDNVIFGCSQGRAIIGHHDLLMFIFNSTLNMFLLAWWFRINYNFIRNRIFQFKMGCILQMYHIINIPEPFALNFILLFNGQRIFVIRIYFQKHPFSVYLFKTLNGQIFIKRFKTKNIFLMLISNFKVILNTHGIQEIEKSILNISWKYTAA